MTFEVTKKKIKGFSCERNEDNLFLDKMNLADLGFYCDNSFETFYYRTTTAAKDKDPLK